MDTAQCTRDAKVMQELGANTIRVYHVDPQADHDGCMSAFANAGIYILVDLDDFATEIDPVGCYTIYSVTTTANFSVVDADMD
jgi:1,3-beta-glucanosyltransferase GAS1